MGLPTHKGVKTGYCSTVSPNDSFCSQRHSGLNVRTGALALHPPWITVGPPERRFLFPSLLFLGALSPQSFSHLPATSANPRH